MNQLWCVRYFVTLYFMSVNGDAWVISVGHIATRSLHKSASHHHLRLLVESPVRVTPPRSSSQSSASQSHVGEVHESTDLVSALFLFGLWVFGICAVVICVSLVTKAKQKSNSFNAAFSKGRDARTTCQTEGEEQDNDAPNSTDYIDLPSSYESRNSDSLAASSTKTPVKQNSVGHRSSALSSVCSLADSDYVNYKTTQLPHKPSACGLSFITSLESDSWLIDESDLEEDEIYAESMVSMDDMESVLASMRISVFEMADQQPEGTVSVRGFHEMSAKSGFEPPSFILVSPVKSKEGHGKHTTSNAMVCQIR